MQRPTLHLLMTSLLVLLVRAESGNLNLVGGRFERSPDIFVDSPEGTATDQEHKLLGLVKNRDGDNTSSRLGGFPQQISEDVGDGTPPYRGNGELLALAGDGLPAVGKRFSEFIGKRAGPGQDTATAYLDDSGFNPELRSLQTVDQEREDVNQLAADMVGNMGLKNLVGGMYNELPSDQLSKREYEFVGKRNYDFVGKRSNDHTSAENKFHYPGKRYDFLGKRSPYEFVGKKSYDFLGKRSPYEFVGKKSYDFLGKRSPYEIVGKKSYDFLGKRSPVEFLGKSNEDNQVVNSGHRVSPFLPTKGLQSTPFYRMQDLPQQSALDVGDADKRYSEFLGKRKRNEGHEEISVSSADRLAALLHNTNADTDKRYSEFLGKRKRSEEHEDMSLSNSERLAALLQNNGLRKRLSRMLLNRRLDDNYPGFIGK